MCTDPSGDRGDQERKRIEVQRHAGILPFEHPATGTDRPRRFRTFEYLDPAEYGLVGVVWLVQRPRCVEEVEVSGISFETDPIRTMSTFIAPLPSSSSMKCWGDGQ